MRLATLLFLDQWIVSLDVLRIFWGQESRPGTGSAQGTLEGRRVGGVDYCLGKLGGSRRYL